MRQNYPPMKMRIVESFDGEEGGVHLYASRLEEGNVDECEYDQYSPTVRKVLEWKNFFGPDAKEDSEKWGVKMVEKW